MRYCTGRMGSIEKRARDLSSAIVGVGVVLLYSRWTLLLAAGGKKSASQGADYRFKRSRIDADGIG